MLDTTAYAALMAGKTPSKFQLPIFTHIEAFFEGLVTQNAIVEAVAGSGKTSTIVAAAKLIPLHVKACFLAFNKKIAEELKEKLPRHVEAMTLNSLGNRIWGDYIKGQGRGYPKLDANKVVKIVRNNLSKGAFQAYGSEVTFLVRMAKAYGVVPRNYHGAENANGNADTAEFWAELVKYYKREIDSSVYDDVIECVRQTLRANLDDETTIDYDDQLYLPVVKRTEHGTTIPHRQWYGAVFLDEAQDLNPVQRVLVKRIMKKGALLVAVGDRKQSIYGFRGAAVDSMDKIEQEFDCVVFPLYYSYRCAKAIVAHAQEVVSHIEAAPGAKEGLVETLGAFNAKMFQPSDLIICRNNAPLINFAYRLIKAKVRCKVLGRDIGKDLVSLINRFEHNNSVAELARLLEEWLHEQIEIIKAKDIDNEAGVQAVQDRYDSISVFVTGTTAKTVSALIVEIEEMFAEPADANGKGFVLLSSGHKSKGLEATRVFHLDSFLLFPRFVQFGTWEYAQEQNLDYVMRTRAKDELYYIETDKLAA